MAEKKDKDALIMDNNILLKYFINFHKEAEIILKEDLEKELRFKNEIKTLMLVNIKKGEENEFYLSNNVNEEDFIKFIVELFKTREDLFTLFNQKIVSLLFKDFLKNKEENAVISDFCRRVEF